jgi:hypothetical protein
MQTGGPWTWFGGTIGIGIVTLGILLAGDYLIAGHLALPWWAGIAPALLFGLTVVATVTSPPLKRKDD